MALPLVKPSHPGHGRGAPRVNLRLPVDLHLTAARKQASDSREKSTSAMARHHDIDHLLRNWKYEPGEVLARIVRTGDGREVIQMRVELGLLQLEVDARPDGTRPGGAETYYDYLVALAVREGEAFQLSEEQQSEVDREFLQFYQRRICWLALRRFDLAVRDADHNLTLLNFIKDCSPSEDWYLAHEQYRPFILFHRTQAAALAQLEAKGPDAAILELNNGLTRLREFFTEHEAEEHFEDDEMVTRLIQLRDSLRKDYNVGPTLEERLAEAVAQEQYELAAKLRDEINRRI